MRDDRDVDPVEEAARADRVVALVGAPDATRAWTGTGSAAGSAGIIVS
jgi:hypothetical protein